MSRPLASSRARRRSMPLSWLPLHLLHPPPWQLPSISRNCQPPFSANSGRRAGRHNRDDLVPTHAKLNPLGLRPGVRAGESEFMPGRADRTGQDRTWTRSQCARKRGGQSLPGAHTHPSSLVNVLWVKAFRYLSHKCELTEPTHARRHSHVHKMVAQLRVYSALPGLGEVGGPSHHVEEYVVHRVHVSSSRHDRRHNHTGPPRALDRRQCSR